MNVLCWKTHHHYTFPKMFIKFFSRVAAVDSLKSLWLALYLILVIDCADVLSKIAASPILNPNNSNIQRRNSVGERRTSRPNAVYTEGTERENCFISRFHSASVGNVVFRLPVDFDLNKATMLLSLKSISCWLELTVCSFFWRLSDELCHI